MDAYQLAGAYARYTNKCIFLTGKAGTGKTTFLKKLQVETNKQMAIVAPTGVAAINAGGTTIHSFFQVPPQLFLPTDQARQQLFQEMQLRRQKIQVLRNLELLVIDEISMVRCDLLDTIDAVLRHFRRRNLPFGGVQLLMIGDLFQLSPVARDFEWDRLRPYYDGQYFFNARVFREVSPIYIELDHVFRQQNQQFVDVLNEVRNNCLTPASRQLLNSRYQPDYKQTEEDFHIILSTHNQKVDGINQEAMDRLPGAPRTFRAKIEGTFPESMFPIDEQLELKEGARVMFIKNDSAANGKRYFNGKLGKIVRFNNDGIVVVSEGEEILVQQETWQNIRYNASGSTETLEAEAIGTFQQYPLRPAWAITIHKSQGLTFDSVVIDAADAFAAGQVYVALSRCRTLEGIILLSPIPASALSNAHEVLRYTEAQPDIEEVGNALPEAELSYLIVVLTSLFDFRDSMRKVDRLRHIISGEAKFSDGTDDYLRARKEELEALQQVGERFQNQIRQYLISGQEIGERLQAAAGYFAPRLIACQQAVRKSETTTDNKDQRQLYEEVINELNTDLCRQLHLIGQMAKQPHLEGYFRARATFPLPTYFISAGEKQDLSEAENGDLLRIFFAKRRKLASEAGVEPYVITPTDVLKRIVAALPTSKRDLMKVKGFGKKKYDIWGEEILLIVRQYLVRKGF